MFVGEISYINDCLSTRFRFESFYFKSITVVSDFYVEPEGNQEKYIAKTRNFLETLFKEDLAATIRAISFRN